MTWPAELDRENTYTDTAQELSCFFFIGYHWHLHRLVAAGVWLGVLAVWMASATLPVLTLSL